MKVLGHVLFTIAVGFVMLLGVVLAMQVLEWLGI